MKQDISDEIKSILKDEDTVFGRGSAFLVFHLKKRLDKRELNIDSLKEFLTNSRISQYCRYDDNIITINTWGDTGKRKFRLREMIKGDEFRRLIKNRKGG